MKRLKQNDSGKMNGQLPLEGWEERTTSTSELWILKTKDSENCLQ